MKQIMRYRFLPSALVGLALIGVGLSGCGSGGGTTSVPATQNATPNASPTPANEPVSTTRSYGDLTFTLSASKRLYARGEPVALTLTVQNTGTSDASSAVLDGRIVNGKYVPSSPIHDLTLADGTLSDAQGNVLVSNLFASNGAGSGGVRTIDYPAGQSKQYFIFWNTYDGVENSYDKTAPSTYRINAYINALDLNGEPVAPYALGTDPLEIHVQ